MAKDKRAGPLPEPGQLQEERWYIALLEMYCTHNIEDDMTFREMKNFLARIIADTKLGVFSDYLGGRMMATYVFEVELEAVGNVVVEADNYEEAAYKAKKARNDVEEIAALRVTSVVALIEGPDEE